MCLSHCVLWSCWCAGSEYVNHFVSRAHVVSVSWLLCVVVLLVCQSLCVLVIVCCGPVGVSHCVSWLLCVVVLLVLVIVCLGYCVLWSCWCVNHCVSHTAGECVLVIVCCGPAAQSVIMFLTNR